MKKNAMRGGAYSAVMTAVVLAILVAVNVLFSALPSSSTEYDISASKLYSGHQQHQERGERADGGCDHLLDRPGRRGG